MGMEVHDEIMGTPASHCPQSVSLLLSLKVYCVLIEVLSLL